jgi:hypothetical protein
LLGGVQQGFLYEMFIHENVMSIRERDLMPCEAGEIWA